MSDNSEIQFRLQIDAWISQHMKKGVRSFCELASSMHGVYPTEIAAGIHRLGLASLLQNKNGLVNSDPQVLLCQENGFPVAHPLDFDWRFSAIAGDNLVRLVTERDDVAIFGAPSLVRLLVKDGLRRISVFDANVLAVNHIRSRHPSVSVKHVDLMSEQIQCKSISNVTFCDPPWYEEHMMSFLWASALATRTKGRIYCSLPPMGTRPSVAEERKRIVNWALTIGLRLVEIQPSRLKYVTPVFERNALRASNTPIPHCNWRHGDLAVFQVVAENTLPFQRKDSPLRLWTESSIGLMRVKLRVQAKKNRMDPTLRSIVDGDILDSVSRRDARRAMVDVWTSGNRVFQCDNTELLKLIVQSVNRELDTSDFLKKNVTQALKPTQLRAAIRVAQQLSNISEVEHREISESLRYNFSS